MRECRSICSLFCRWYIILPLPLISNSIHANYAQVVGEIYDEDDEQDFVFAEDSITFQDDGTFLIRGDADLEDVDAVLGLSLDDEEVLKEFGTLSGFLCFCAGEIPRVGDFVMSRGWNFEVVDADMKRIYQVKVERLLGFFDGEDNEGGDENLVRGFFNRIGANNEDASIELDGELTENLVADSLAVVDSDMIRDDDGMSDTEAVSLQAQIMNKNEARRMERLVEQNEMLKAK